MQHGFTLIQISILLLVASLALVACLPGIQMKPAQNTASISRMNAVLLALRRYEAANARLPCPADASQPVGSATYGVAAANPGTTTNCTGGVPSANYVDSTHQVAIGMVPVRDLGLSGEYALDSYGRAFTYAVDTNATQCFTGTLPGQITVTDNGIANTTVAVLVSHGANGHGAWIPLAGASGSAVRLNSGSSDAGQLTNAHVNSAFNPTTPLNGFVRKTATTTFDDLVVYSNPSWSLASIPTAASAVLPTITPPINNIYISGQSLSFTLTYNQNVSVTGSPSLALGIGSTTRYATYSAGSGTQSLTFSYTLQSADYAPSGISLNSPVNVSAGSLSTACTSFTLPTLTGVDVKKMYIYVADFNNSRVEKFDANGNYLSTIGAYGILAGLFVHPYQLSADTSGNIWVADYGNSRVEEFNSSGSYVKSIGTFGSANGQFINAAAVSVDGSGNVWVTDSGNNRVQEFTGGGSYKAKFGSAGSGNGQLALPTGIAMDTSGNIWVDDWGNGRIEEFSSAGGFLGKVGALGSGNGQFINPCDHAVDPSGNLWISDNGNNRVEEFSGSGSYLGQFGTYGSGNGQIKGPCGIAADKAGNIWVADTGGNRVQEFNSTGVYQKQFGSLGSGNGQFWTPVGLALSYQ